jgi:hypothetical protein
MPQNLPQFYQDQIMNPNIGFNFTANLSKLQSPSDFELSALLKFVYALPISKDFYLNPDLKLTASDKTEFIRIRYEDLSEFWQHFLKQWYDWVCPDSFSCFEGDNYCTDSYSNGYDMYESASLYYQKERWFNLPDFIEYTMSLQVHDHCLILRVYDYSEPVLLYYIQII